MFISHLYKYAIAAPNISCFKNVGVVQAKGAGLKAFILALFQPQVHGSQVFPLQAI